jgi:hypothetical protein
MNALKREYFHVPLYAWLAGAAALVVGIIVFARQKASTATTTTGATTGTVSDPTTTAAAPLPFPTTGGPPPTQPLPLPTTGSTPTQTPVLQVSPVTAGVTPTTGVGQGKALMPATTPIITPTTGISQMWQAARVISTPPPAVGPPIKQGVIQAGPLKGVTVQGPSPKKAPKRIVGPTPTRTVPSQYQAPVATPDYSGASKHGHV